MPASNLIAFDLGAESGRAVLGRLDGQRLALTEVHRFANVPVRMNGHLHWDLLALWRELKAGLRNAAAAARQTPLDGLGVDTWGVDFGLLGRNGEILGVPVCYRDARTDGVMDEVLARLGRRRVFEATGIQFLPFNTLFQLVAMQRCGSGLLDAAERILFMPDLLHFLLAGRTANEFSVATTSQMYDPRAGDWAWDLLRELDLPTRLLGDVVPAGTVLGPVRDEVAAECDVPPVPVITPASHDTGSAVASVPAEGDGWCYISSGTWSLMGVELAAPVINDKSLAYNYTNEGGVGGSIRFLKNIAGLWLVQECRRHWQGQGDSHDYAELTEMAAAARPFAAVLEPDHQSFLTPGEMPARIEAYCRQTGQIPPASKGEMVRTCLEGLALAYRRTLEGLEDVLGRRIEVIHIVGGGCRNGLLNQLTADACGRVVIAGPVEATAIGNVLCQAMAIGRVGSLAEARDIVRASFEVVRYEPREPGAWDQAWQRYRQLAGH